MTNQSQNSIILLFNIFNKWFYSQDDPIDLSLQRIELWPIYQIRGELIKTHILGR